MRSPDELYVGAWGGWGDRKGFLVRDDRTAGIREARCARTGVVLAAPDFKRLPTTPNTPREVRPGVRGFLASEEGRVAAVYDDGRIGFAAKSGRVFEGAYSAFRPFYASNH